MFGRPVIDEAMVDEVVATLRDRWIGTGPRSRRFAEEVRALVGAPAATALGSCTAGIQLALLAAGIRPGDEIVTPTYTFPSTVNAILNIGAVPVLTDVDPLTQNIDAEHVERAISDRTRAVIPVHMAGRPCDVDSIMSVAHRHGAVVVEDAAHALGAEIDRRPIGSISDATCFSFYATKNVTTAEGGLVATTHPEWIEPIETMSLHGLSKDAWQRYDDVGPGQYLAVLPGFKCNMTDLHAALGLGQLRHFEAWQKRRAEIWEEYDRAFSDLPLQTPPPTPGNMKHALHLYTVLVEPDSVPNGRDGFRLQLHQRMIGTGIHFVAVHLHPYFEQRLRHNRGDFPVSEWLSDRTVSLPLAPDLNDDDVADVIHAVRSVFDA